MSPEQQAAGEALNFSPNRRKVTFPVTLWPQKKPIWPIEGERKINILAL